MNCGAEISDKWEKVANPLKHTHGKNKGQERKCCDNPDWRLCEGQQCEGDAIVCRSCGYYNGPVNW